VLLNRVSCFFFLLNKTLNFHGKEEKARSIRLVSQRPNQLLPHRIESEYISYFGRVLKNFPSNNDFQQFL